MAENDKKATLSIEGVESSIGELQKVQTMVTDLNNSLINIGIPMPTGIGEFLGSCTPVLDTMSGAIGIVNQVTAGVDILKNA